MNLIIQIVNHEDRKLFYDLEERIYILYLVLNHIMWYDVYINVIEEEANIFLGHDGSLNLSKFESFVSQIARFKPGLGRQSPWEERVLPRSFEDKIKNYFPS